MKALVQMWLRWDTAQRVIVLSGCMAFISMFMNWMDVGFFTRIGVSQGVFVFLLFWYYPIRSLLISQVIRIHWGLINALGAILCGLFYIESKSINLGYFTDNAASVGAWTYLAASGALGLGVVALRENRLKITNFLKVLAKGVSTILAATVEWFKTGRKKTKVAATLIAAIALFLAYDEARSDIGIFSRPTKVARISCIKALLSDNPDYQILSTTVVEGRDVIGGEIVPISVTVVVQWRGSGGVKKGIAKFACDKRGKIIRIVSAKKIE